MSESQQTPQRRIDSRTAKVDARYRRLLDDGADPNEWAFAWRTELNRGGFRAFDFLM
jgi:hypothetical protein